jgi:hypothetical protein
MEIHRPKPARNWREFAKEVGVIVVGVCIALAGEQAVAWLHWRNEISETRNALNKEVAYNLGAIQKRREEAPCIDHRLAEIKDLLKRDSAVPSSATRAPLGQPQLWRPHTNVWQAALAGQAAAHMPLEMRLSYAEAYDGFQWYGQKAADESDAWGDLAELDDGGPIGPEEEGLLRRARSRAQVAADKLNANLPGYGAIGARLGVAPAAIPESALTAAALKALCRPLS